MALHLLESELLVHLPAPGRFPYSFQEVLWFFKVPRIRSVEVGRLGQWLKVPTQGQRVAQIGDVS